MAHGTFTQVNLEPEPLVKVFRIYDNFGRDMESRLQTCTGCPPPSVPGNVSGGPPFWQPEGWLIIGPNDPNFPGIGGQSIANPFVPPLSDGTCNPTCHITQMEIPIQQTARTGTTEEFQIGIFPDDGVDEPAFGNALQLAAWAHADADPVFPVCCLTKNAVEVVYSPGLAVNGGQQYWLVVDADAIYGISADSNDQDNAAIATEDVWAFNTTTEYGRISPTFFGNNGFGTWRTFYAFVGSLFPINPGGSTAPAMKLTGTSP
jgi:hypothetical protein